MIFDFKKIASAAASTLMIGSTIAVAAAANFPAPFVSGSTSDVAIVYGHNFDLGAVTDITTSLSSSLSSGTGTSAGTTPTGGDFVQLDKSSDRLNLGNALNGPFGSTVDDDDLPKLFADGTYKADDNDEFDYEQTLTLGSTAMSHFRDSDYESLAGLSTRTPTVGFRVTSGTLMTNYTLDFLSDAESDVTSGDLEDIEGSDLPLFGKTFYVSDAKNGTTANYFGKFILLDSATTGIVSEGETQTLVVNGKSYDVGLNFIGETTVKFDVNGEVTNSLASGETYRLSDGTYIGAREINTQNYAGGIKNTEFSLGSGKLEITSGSDIKLNDDSIEGVKAWVVRGTATSTQKIDKIVIEWKVDDEEFLGPNLDLTMPGFGALKFSMNKLMRPTEEKVTVQPDGDESIQITVPIVDGDANFNLLFSTAGVAGGNFSGLGKDTDERLATSPFNSIEFFEKKAGNDYHAWFVATYNTTDEGESYLLRAKISEDTSDNRNETIIEKWTSGGWVTACDEKTATNTCSSGLGDVEITIQAVNKNASDEWVNISAVNKNVNFNTIFTKGGLKLYLPFDANATGGAATSKGAINLSEGLTANVGHNSDRWWLFFDEEDKDDNIASGLSGNLSLDSTSENKLHVSQIRNSGSGGPTGLEVGDGTGIYEAYLTSDVASRTLHYTNPDEDWAEIYYPSGPSKESESYAEVFLSDISASTGSGGELGGISVMDTELASSGMQTKNLVVVGGSCVNSAAATLIGVSKPTCGPAWTSATGVGSGEFLVQTFTNPWSSSKIATLVAGYEKDDTVNAATFLTTKTVDTTAGKKYVGSEATSATLVTA